MIKTVTVLEDKVIKEIAEALQQGTYKVVEFETKCDQISPNHYHKTQTVTVRVGGFLINIER